MKVILKQSVPKVGKEGEVVVVKPGFARNFLFPRGMAIVADRNQLKAHEKRNERVQAKLEETKADAEKVAEGLNGKSIEIRVNAGDKGKLYGAVTSADIQEKIKEDLGVEVERKQVLLMAPLKRLGDHEVEIDLHRLVDCAINVNLFDPDYQPEEPESIIEEEEAPAEEASAEAPAEAAEGEASEEVPEASADAEPEVAPEA